MSPRVALIILNWKKTQETLECLAHAFSSDFPLDMVVVDNHSEQDLTERIRQDYPQVAVIENKDNQGYAGGNNTGIRYALEHGADYIFILNNDASLLPGTVTALLEASRSLKDEGLLAPKVLIWENPKPARINSLGTRMDWLRLRPRLGRYGQTDTGSEAEPFQEEVLMGCALFASRRTLEKIGLLDENFFLILEDADWSFRARKAGVGSWVVPQALVYHKGSKTLNEVPRLSHYYSTRNFFYLAAKHANPGQKLMVLAGALFLIFKNLYPWVLGAPRSRIFFMALGDFLAGNMGPCSKNLDAGVASS